MKQATSAGIILYHRPCANSLVYLILQYAFSERYANVSNHWDFAKGHVDAQETLQQTALREVAEETGLIPQINSTFSCSFTYFLKDKDQHPIAKNVHLFLGEVDTQEVNLSPEHTNFAWLPFEEAIIQLTHDNARDALARAHKFLKPRVAPASCC